MHTSANNVLLGPAYVIKQLQKENERLQKVVDATAKIEREACAKLVEEHKGIYLRGFTSTNIVQKIAEAIRNRV